MPEIIETTVYQLHELSDAAKDKARGWYRRIGFDFDWHDAVYDDFERICAILGVSLATRTDRLFGGGVRPKPCIWFSGFWSQGDGACFERHYRHAKGARTQIRAYAPKDAELHRIADCLEAAQRRNFYQLQATVTHRGRYYHEHCMAISVKRDSPTGQDMSRDAEDIVIEAMRDLARWLYRQLEREYDDQTSDAFIDDAICANAYTFTEEGRRFG